MTKLRGAFREFIRFLFVGCLNTFLGIILIFFIYNQCYLGYWGSSALAYILVSVLSFILNRKIVFSYNTCSFKVILRFVLNITISYLLSYSIARIFIPLLCSGLLKHFTEPMQNNIILIGGACLFTCLNFLGQKFIVFKTNTNKKHGKDKDL